MLTIQTKTATALRELAAEKPVRLRVQGDCMKPWLRSGSSVEVAGKRFYWPGDVIIVQGADGCLLAHRLIGYYVKSGQLKWLTQADNAERPDCAVLTQQVIGRICGGECSPTLIQIPFMRRLNATMRFIRFTLTLFWSSASNELR